jgi:hypothetical protein
VHWIFKNKDHGKTSATASLGLISLWDVEGGLPLIDKCVRGTGGTQHRRALHALCEHSAVPCFAAAVHAPPPCMHAHALT